MDTKTNTRARLNKRARYVFVEIALLYPTDFSFLGDILFY